MIIKYFAIYDKKSSSYSPLFPSQTYGTAERAFRDSINNKETPHNKYPDDFALYYIGDFDDESGQFTQYDKPPQLIIEGSALVTPN